MNVSEGVSADHHWQPIETAPKDGRFLMLLEPSDSRDQRDDYGGNVFVGFWHIQDIGPENPGNEGWCCWISGHKSHSGWVQKKAAYWMLLPLPPSPYGRSQNED